MEDHTVTAHGVFFNSEQAARTYAENHEKDVVQIEGGWLAANRETSKGHMPTKEGDVVFLRNHQLYRVWTVTADDAQEPDPLVAPFETWERAKAEEAARNWARETKGRVFLLQSDGEWVIRERI